MDDFQIETAQNITIKQNVADVGSRIGAFLLDMLIIAGFYLIIILIINALDFKPDVDQYIFFILLGLPIFFYHLLFETLMDGQSPGKYFTKIRVVKIDGSKPTIGNYLIRWILRIIDISLASGSVALLTILLNGKGQRLGDLAAGTTVITEQQQYTIHSTLNVDITEDYKPLFPQVSTLSDNDIQIIKELYAKSKRDGSHATILKLHAKIIELTGITTDMKPVDFVDKIIKDYNYYTQQM